MKKLIKNLKTIFAVLFIICGYSWIFDISLCFNSILIAIVLTLPVTACEILDI